MDVIPVRILAKNFGNGLHFPLNTDFVMTYQVKKADYVLPCIIDNKKLVEKDPVLGAKRELIFRFRRNATGLRYEALDDADMVDVHGK